MSEARSLPQVEIMEKEPPRWAGALVGGASALAGGLLFVLFVQQRLAPQMFRLPPFPFFDRFALWDRLSLFTGLHLLASLLLMGVAWAIFTRRRWASWAFVIPGWGGLFFLIAAVWPGEQIRFKMQTLLTMAQRSGRAGADATFWSLIPAPYLFGLIVFVGIWVGLLVFGTVHLLRCRDPFRG